MGAPLFACPHCDALHTQLCLHADESAECGQCAFVLARGSKLKVVDWLALVLGALLLFAIANLVPLVSLTLQGRTVSPNVPSALLMTWQQGHYGLAVMSGLMGLGFPLLLLLFKLWALWLIKARRVSLDFALGMRVIALLEHWSMVPVVFLGILVALVKFAGIAILKFDFGILAYALLMLVYTATVKLDSRRLWEMAAEAGNVINQADSVDSNAYIACTACGLVQSPTAENQGCQRCESRLTKRKPNMRSRTSALLAAAMFLYIPANVLPIMQLRSPLGASEHTILGGVIELWQSGSPDLGIVVFMASIVVPLTKFIALLSLLYYSHWQGRVVQRQRTRLYEFIEFIGQWSMLDVFVVVLMGAMADFPGLSQVIAGPAAFSFGLVVVLTMLATLNYDSRVGWDTRTAALQSSSLSTQPFKRLGKQ